MRKAHTFPITYIAKTQESTLADAVPRHPPLSSRLLPFLPKCPQGDIPLSASSSLGVQNQSWSLHVTTWVLCLSDPQYNTMETARVLHQGGATHAPRTLYRFVFQKQPPVCDTAMQSVLLSEEFSHQSPQTLIKHWVVICLYKVSCL